MEKTEAINIIKQLASTVKATVQEHQIIQQAIMKLDSLTEPKNDEKPKKDN